MTKEEILLKDYESTQAFIDKIDKYLFWIRNWTIVTCSAVIVFAVTHHNSVVLLFNALLICGFLFVELIQKSFHEDAIKHSYKIEEIIQESLLNKKPFPDDYQFGLGHSIDVVTLSRLKSILLHPGRWHNLAFYLLILCFTIATFFVIPLFHEGSGLENEKSIETFENNKRLNQSNSIKDENNENIELFNSNS